VLLWRYLFARTLTFPHIDFGGLHTKFGMFTGTSLWVSCDRGTATCNAYTNGILLHGIRFVQAKPDKLQPSQPSESVLRIAGAPLAREHGGEAKANQDASQPQSIGTDDEKM
jgi:hypothetical protein